MSRSWDALCGALSLFSFEELALFLSRLCARTELAAFEIFKFNLLVVLPTCIFGHVILFSGDFRFACRCKVVSRRWCAVIGGKAFFKAGWPHGVGVQLFARDQDLSLPQRHLKQVEPSVDFNVNVRRGVVPSVKGLKFSAVWNVCSWELIETDGLEKVWVEFLLGCSRVVFVHPLSNMKLFNSFVGDSVSFSSREYEGFVQWAKRHHKLRVIMESAEHGDGLCWGAIADRVRTVFVWNAAATWWAVFEFLTHFNVTVEDAYPCGRFMDRLRSHPRLCTLRHVGFLSIRVEKFAQTLTQLMDLQPDLMTLKAVLKGDLRGFSRRKRVFYRRKLSVLEVVLPCEEKDPMWDCFFVFATKVIFVC